MESIASRLYVRTAADGQEVGADRLDPLLWANTRHLLSGESHKRAVAVLDEFLNHHGEQLIPDPLRRAILQRDLWAVFDWAAYGVDTAEQKEERNKLLVRLAAAIGRVALTNAQIQNLPDNLAAAVASKSFATRYDSMHPQVEFLPRDLLDTDGPWICLKANDGRTITPMHDHGFGGRSVFLVLLRFPGGRQATLDYLAKLRNFENPWMGVNDRQPTLNPELPQFPTGTEVALVRRAILIDYQGKLVATRLVESIQLRHFRKFPGPHDDPAERDKQDQDVYEFQLSRKKLFAGEAGGLFSPELDFLFVQFQSMGIDALERADLESGGASKLQGLVRNSCSKCHVAPGIFSLRSFQASFPAQGYGRRNWQNLNWRMPRAQPFIENWISVRGVSWRDSHCGTSKTVSNRADGSIGSWSSAPRLVSLLQSRNLKRFFRRAINGPFSGALRVLLPPGVADKRITTDERASQDCLHYVVNRVVSACR